MRLATLLADDGPTPAVVRGDRAIPIDPALGLGSVREICAGGRAALDRIGVWLDARPAEAGVPITATTGLGPPIPDPGAIYTIGLNYGPADGPDPDRPERPLVYGKAASSVTGDRSTIRWDRALTPNVDAEVELGIVIGAEAVDVSAEDAMGHVFGYTCVNDVSSRDAWLDGDQWLLGKSMPGFCPVGPWIVTADELAPDEARLGCTINGIAIQDGSTAQMRFSIPEIVAFLSRHARLRPGDLIASGTPPRLAGPLGPDRHLEPGDAVTVWIEGIGELRSTIG
jgi:2-keto-4-pentenoate hydratase/2-oxohepta-3-ene-1,7-dioic acid hydratase in catechol pathway